jgi:Fe-S-cluster containining protein
MTPDIPQVIPEGRCLTCDVCCRFPEADSPMRPYFTATEIDAAIARGVPVEQFPDRAGGRVTLVPHPAGEGFMCPAFDVATNQCTIYDDRPLDCRLYPFVVMRSPEGMQPLLGWDRLCPYLREESDPMLPVVIAPTIARRLFPDDAPSPLVNDPGFAGPCQDSAWMLEPLAPLQPSSPFQIDRVEVPSTPPVPQLIPVGDDPDEIERLRRFLIDAVETPLSVLHPAVLLMWRPLMRFFWMDLAGSTALVVRQAATYFAPVPPRPRDGPSSGDNLASVCRKLLAVLNQFNSNPTSSRIERIGKSQQQLLAGSGLVCRPEGDEYLYDRRALAELRGDRYKSQRWNCNQAARRFQPRYEHYRSDDMADCLRLYATWRRLKERRGRTDDDYAAGLMADSFYAHWQALAHADAWGLAARVVRVDGRICAYTVGAPLDERTMVIVHEIADPACPGLGPWLFRAWCREWDRYEMVNVMDDSELRSLRREKSHYRPVRKVASFHASLLESNCHRPII